LRWDLGSRLGGTYETRMDLFDSTPFDSGGESGRLLSRFE
jgi:hypothetical protein